MKIDNLVFSKEKPNLIPTVGECFLGKKGNSLVEQVYILALLSRSWWVEVRSQPLEWWYVSIS